MKMLGKSFALFLFAAFFWGQEFAQAHHSFAAFFDQNKKVKLAGKVSQFRFSNPHGMIEIKVSGKDGKVEVWKAETNSPSVLKRRGWTTTSIEAGDVVTIEGWPARDGAHYIRLFKAWDDKGKQIGESLDGTQEK